MTKLISIQINGKKEEIDSALSLQSYLESVNISPNVVACELNLKVIKRAALPETYFKENDIFEIIQMIGGG